MKFSEVKIGQTFKRTVKNILFIKIAKNKYAYNDEVSTIADVNEEVELISKCKNCRYYKEEMDEYSNGNSYSYYICGYLYEQMDENAKAFSCSEFLKKEGE